MIWAAVCSGFLDAAVTPVPTRFFLIGGGGWVVLVYVFLFYVTLGVLIDETAVLGRFTGIFYAAF